MPRKSASARESRRPLSPRQLVFHLAALRRGERLADTRRALGCNESVFYRVVAGTARSRPLEDRICERLGLTARQVSEVPR